MREVPAWFAAQLTEALDWCRWRAGFADRYGGLRSSDLRPGLGPHDGTATALNVNAAMVAGVIQRRRKILAERGCCGSNQPLRNGGGRLLLCAYAYTNHNGASADVTSGFLDDHDVPPWDTWVGEVSGHPGRDRPGTWGGTWPPTLESALSLGERPPHRGLLVSWVPPEFVDVVQRGIDVECIGMLCWVGGSIASGGAGPRFERMVPAWLRRCSGEG